MNIDFYFLNIMKKYEKVIIENNKYEYLIIIKY